MKALNLMLIIIIISSSCTKSEISEVGPDSQPASATLHQNSNQVKQIAIFKDKNAFNKKIEELNTFFKGNVKPAQKPIGKIIKKPEEISSPSQVELNKLIDNLSESDFITDFVNSKVEEHEKFTTEFPQLASTNTIYNTYIDLLKTKNEQIWKQAAQENPDFFQYEKGLVLLLSHTQLLSAIANMDFAYQVGQEIAVQRKTGTYFISNGNYNLINNVQSNQSTDISFKAFPVKHSVRGYSLFTTKDFYFGSGLRLHTRLLRDYIFFGDGCAFSYSTYAQTEAYTQIMNNGAFVAYNAAAIIVGIDNTNPSAIPGGPFSSGVTSTHYCVAGGHFGCASNNNNQFKADYYYKVAAGWAYLYYTSTVSM